MEVVKFEGQARGHGVPTLPGAPAPDTAPTTGTPGEPAGPDSLDRMGYVGQAMLAMRGDDAPAVASETDDAAVDAPSLPTSPAPFVDTSPHAEPAAAVREPDAAPVNPNTGLPMYPTGDVTETPEWKKRKNSTARRVLRVVALLAVIAIFVVVVLAGFEAYRPSDSASSPEPSGADPTTAAANGDAARPEVAALLDELAASEVGDPIPPTDVNSYWFTWVDPFGFAATAGADSASGDFTATVTPSTEIIRVDGRNFARVEDGPWIELSDAAGATIPSTLLGGPLEVDDVLPRELAEYIVADGVRDDGQLAYLIDDARLAAERPEARTRWLAPWGLLADAPVVEPVDRSTDIVPAEAARGDVVVFVSAANNGVVRGFSISAPAIGGTVGYVLNETDARPLTIAIPAPFAGG